MIVRLGITDHCNIACFISILLIEQKLQAPDSMSYLIHSKSHQAIYLLAVTSSMGHKATFYRMSRKTLSSCHHAIMPHCPSFTLTEDDVSSQLVTGLGEDGDVELTSRLQSAV